MNKKLCNFPFLQNANASYFDILNTHAKILSGTKAWLGHPKYVAEGALRGTQTQTDGTVPSHGYKLDVFYGRAKDEDSITMFCMTTHYVKRLLPAHGILQQILLYITFSDVQESWVAIVQPKL